MSQERLPIEVGAVLDGRYLIESVLGAGGMGAVFQARHLALGERVAIKFVLSEFIGNPETEERFQREARIAVHLKNSHIVRVRDFGRIASGAPYMVMELLEGSDLGKLMEQQGRFTPELAVRYVLDACEAIAEAHAHKLVHRDLKPANMFLTQLASGESVVKVLDFGIAKSLNYGQAAVVTQTSAVFGSPYYMSPEQMRASRDVDARADIWALGVCLYEFLTGTLPFLGNTAPELFAAVLKDTPLSLRKHNEDVPDALAAAVLRCLEKDPERRFATVRELALAIGDSLGPVMRQRAEAIPARYEVASWDVSGPVRAASVVPPPSQPASQSVWVPGAEERASAMRSADTVLATNEGPHDTLREAPVRRGPRNALAWGLAAAVAVGVTVLVVWTGHWHNADRKPAPSPEPTLLSATSEPVQEAPSVAPTSSVPLPKGTHAGTAATLSTRPRVVAPVRAPAQTSASRQALPAATVIDHGAHM